MFCTHCGATLGSNDLVCPQCNAPVSDADAEPDFAIFREAYHNAVTELYGYDADEYDAYNPYGTADDYGAYDEEPGAFDGGMVACEEEIPDSTTSENLKKAGKVALGGIKKTGKVVGKIFSKAAKFAINVGENFSDCYNPSAGGSSISSSSNHGGNYEGTQNVASSTQSAYSSTPLGDGYVRREFPGELKPGRADAFIPGREKGILGRCNSCLHFHQMCQDPHHAFSYVGLCDLNNHETRNYSAPYVNRKIARPEQTGCESYLPDFTYLDFPR